jgi:ABC-type transporter Mla maintaining outer membrane lipid asymmetry ATPase subunit MlaF
MAADTQTSPVAGEAVLATRGLRLSRGVREILKGVDLGVARGEVLALMGLSGSGKTTILRTVAGLERFNGGEFQVDTMTVAAGTPLRRVRAMLHQRVGMVFQFHYLFEHLSALENVCLAPVRVQRRGRADRRSGWRSRARWPSIRRCCCSMSRPHRSIRRAATSSENRSASSPAKAARW